MTAEKIDCKVCEKKGDEYQAHVLISHLREKHDMDPMEYMEEFNAPWYSEHGQRELKEQVLRTPREKKEITLNKLFPNFETRFAPDDVYKWRFKEPDITTPRLDKFFSFPEHVTLELITILEKETRNNIYVAGPSGSGKTSLVRAICAKLNAPLYEVNLDVQFGRQHLFGAWRVHGSNMVFEYGPIPRWLKRGGVMLFNEYDTLDPSTTNMLKPILEEPRRCRLVENNDEEIIGHPDCRVIVTANTWARGDDSGMFVNTEVQSTADIRRFHAFFLVDYLGEKQEKALLSNMFEDVPEKAVVGFVKIANQIRKGFTDGKLTRTLSTAELVNWAENYSIFGNSAHHSARVSFLNGYEDAMRAAVREMINNTFGQEDRETLLSASTASKAAANAPDAK